jgi:phenylpropionate dioxygenase-like ring-hydroxylating dioxygenase large terminal subunit
MLSPEENELLTRVGPGTPMGTLMRRYWVPALLAEELPEPDGAPVRVQLLGERLVAFRDTAGRVGLLAEACPHRGASLALGRNENHALRCIYHGWQFDVSGRCLDTPSEPADSTYRERVRAQTYPVREVAGVVWTYLGPPDKLPHFPEYRWLQLYPTQSAAFKLLEECNYAQALEGGLDLAHAPILHRYSPWSVRSADVRQQNLAPRHEVRDTPYGLQYGAIWRTEGGQQHVRILPYIMPWWTIVAPDAFGGRPASADRIVNAWVPRDDTTTWHFQYFFNPEEPIDVEWRKQTAGFHIDAEYRKTRNLDNWWLQDREDMKLRSMSGIDGIVTQDHAVNESQGPIVNRSKEHLGASDAAIVGMRRLLLRAARDVVQGIEPPGLDPAIPFDRITSATFDAPADVPWYEATPAR